MTESIAILVERHRDPDGVPTCCRHIGDQQCRFLEFRSQLSSVPGPLEVCVLTGAELHRFGYVPGGNEWAADGWVRPSTGCPVWAAEVKA